MNLGAMAAFRVLCVMYDRAKCNIWEFSRIIKLSIFTRRTDQLLREASWSPTFLEFSKSVENWLHNDLKCLIWCVARQQTK